jgi:hypothetical protein
MSMAKNKSLAFEYIVYSLMKIEIDKNIDLSQVIQSFSKEKILLLPFFVTIGNGSRDSLMELFDQFYPTSYGIIDIELEKHIDEIFNFENHRIQVTDFNSIEDKINSIRLSISDNYSKIDKSIQHLYFKFDNFALLEFDTLSYWSRNNLSWQIFFQIINANLEEKSTHFSTINSLFRENMKNENFILSPISKLKSA